MKEYPNPRKFHWACPICFKEKWSGGLGHIQAQACGHMRRKHDRYETAGMYITLGLNLARLKDRQGYIEAHLEKNQLGVKHEG